MSAPAWLRDAIHAAEPACVPTVPKQVNQPWEQVDSPESRINKGVKENVPNVPTVPMEIGLPQDAGPVDAHGSSSDRDRLPASHAEIWRERRRATVLAMLEAAPGTRYAVHVADAATDPVVVAVCIREVVTFEMAIPHKYYDGFTLLELIEKQSGEKYANN
ncbi:MAG: hypothetical protein DID91_2727703888 [Candidatus Nitrotoga sp. MKT]|nr:MAG: hypothetical protein DID91_2727703888 [Candidatus Nitrotoga sp. MKT]